MKLDKVRAWKSNLGCSQGGLDTDQNNCYSKLENLLTLNNLYGSIVHKLCMQIIGRPSLRLNLGPVG